MMMRSPTQNHDPMKTRENIPSSFRKKTAVKARKKTMTHAAKIPGRYLSGLRNAAIW